MKAVLLTGHGGPEKLEYREDVPTPEPTEDEVLIEVGAALDAVSGQHFDVVADVVGGGIFPELLDILKPLGRYVTAGAIAGPMVNLDLRTLYLKHLELIGSTIGTHEEFSDLVNYIEAGKTKPLLAGVYPLSEIKHAQEDFERKDFFGKLVLVPDRGGS